MCNSLSTTCVYSSRTFMVRSSLQSFRIKAVRAEDFCVEITTTSSDLNDEVNWEERYSKDGNPYYHVLTLDERRAIEVEKKRLAR